MKTLSQIAKALGCELRGPADLLIAHVASIGNATPETLVFAEDEAAFGSALTSSAAAIIVSQNVANAEGRPLLIHPNPRLTFARAAHLLAAAEAAAGIHPSAVIASTATLAANAAIAAFAVIGDHAVIGELTSIAAGAVIGHGVRIGRECRIYPRVVLYPGVSLGDRVVIHAGAVLGADGFGYVRDPATGGYTQFPQQGTLVIEDDVEIGANSTIDCGALEETRIGRGTKIDNLVHIGHNCNIGSNIVMAAQAGISGSSRIGDGAVLGGQVGIGDHAEVGEGVILGGQGGVLPHKRLRGAGQLFWGTPAKPVRTYLRELVTLARLASGKGEAKEK